MRRRDLIRCRLGDSPAAALLATLLAALLAAAGCDNLSKPRAQRDNAAPPAKSAVAPGGCDALCERHAACLASFQRLGAEPLFVTPASVPCASACDTTARDPLVGTTLARVLEGCGAHLDCDRFFGCALRLWLTHLAAHPWKRAVLRAQRVTRDVAAALRDARLQEATRLCGSADTFDALDKRTEPAAVGAARGLAYACAGAMQARLEGGIQTLEVLRTKLDPDAHGARCRELRAWRAPPWLPAQHPARERISRARALCDALDSQRPLAFAVRYAERDAALVKAALVAGRADDAAYHKCAHKGKTFATLQGSTLPRARAAAKILRRVCFERFGTAFLARHRRAGAAFEKRHCYKIRVVTALVTSHATPAVLSANLALVRWAKARCPAP